MRSSARLAPLLVYLFSSVVIFSTTGKWKLTQWYRLSDNPILCPHGTSWQSAGTFNPAVVLYNGKFVMLYRAQDKNGTSRLGYAESSDGLHFTRRPEPVLSPDAGYEKSGGGEGH